VGAATDWPADPPRRPPPINDLDVPDPHTASWMASSRISLDRTDYGACSDEDSVANQFSSVKEPAIYGPSLRNTALDMLCSYPGFGPTFGASPLRVSLERLPLTDEQEHKNVSAYLSLQNNTTRTSMTTFVVMS
jgi:hypothetical protein